MYNKKTISDMLMFVAIIASKTIKPIFTKVSEIILEKSLESRLNHDRKYTMGCIQSAIGGLPISYELIQ